MHTIFIEALAITAVKRSQVEECVLKPLKLAFLYWEDLDFSGNLFFLFVCFGNLFLKRN